MPPLVFASHPQPPVLIDAGQSMFSLDPHMAYLRDASGELTLADVQQLGERFVPAHHRRELQLSYIADEVWLRVELQSVAARPVERILALEYAYLDRVTLYQVRASGV